MWVCFQLTMSVCFQDGCVKNMNAAQLQPLWSGRSFAEVVRFIFILAPEDFWMLPIKMNGEWINNNNHPHTTEGVTFFLKTKTAPSFK